MNYFLNLDMEYFFKQSQFNRCQQKLLKSKLREKNFFLFSPPYSSDEDMHELTGFFPCSRPARLSCGQLLDFMHFGF